MTSVIVTTGIRISILMNVVWATIRAIRLLD